MPEIVPPRLDTLRPLPETDQLLAVAQRVVWFQEPAETLQNPVHFLAHVMTYGTIEDLIALDGIVGPDDYREVLRLAPPGIFDARSWAYWHARLGLKARRLPVRRLEGSSA
jgi:hypothetical protein